MATSATQLLVRLSYPKVPGDQPWSIIDVYGPASYVPVTPGSPGPPVVAPSGGQQIFAQDFGLSQLDFAICSGRSNDGVYAVSLIPVNGKPGAAPTVYAPGNPFDSLILDWAEVSPQEETPPATNLSGSYVRVWAIGRY